MADTFADRLDDLYWGPIAETLTPGSPVPVYREAQVSPDAQYSYRGPRAPTSQTVAAGLGATPQQTAMTGTQAQVQASIADRVAQATLTDSTQAQQQELSRVGRLMPKEREATVAEAMEIERQGKLAKLGNIGQSIQNTIQQNIASLEQVQTGQTKVSQPILAQSLGLAGATLDQAKADPTSDYNRVTRVLETYLASGNPNDLETAFAAIDNLKVFGMSSADAKRLIGLTQETMAKQTGQAVSENVMDQVTMNDIDLQGLGFDQGAESVAALLDMTAEEFGQLSLDEFADTINAKQKAEFARVANLKAEMAATPPGSIRREILLQELRDLGQVGITGVEAAVVETVEDIDLAQSIKVGDDLIKVKDFLDDDNLSQMVMDWINEDDPARKDEIISPEQFPELVSWIGQNHAALAQLSSTADDTKEAFDAANAANKTLNVIDGLDVGMTADVMAKLMPNWDPETAITSSQLADAQARFTSSIVGQLSGSTVASRQEKRDILNKFNMLEGDMLDTVLDLTVDDARAAHAAAEILEDNRDLGRFFGLDSAQGFVLDKDVQDKIDSYDEVVSAISRRNPEWLNTGGATLDLLKTLAPDDLQALVDNPTRYGDLDLYTKKRQALSQARTADDYLSIAFDEDVSFSDVLDEFQDAKKWASLGDYEAKKRLATLTKLFGSSTPSEASVRERFGGNLGKALQISARNVIDGRLDKNAILAPKNTFANRSRVRGASGLHRVNEKFINDGVLSIVDLQAMTPAQQEEIGRWADTVPGIKVNLNGFSSYADYDDDLKEQDFMRLADKAAERADLDSLDNYESFKAEMAVDRIPTQVQLTELQDFATILQSEIPAAKTAKQRDLFEELLKDVEATLANARELFAADGAADAEAAERLRQQIRAGILGNIIIEGVGGTDRTTRPASISDEPITSGDAFSDDSGPTGSFSMTL